MLVYSPLYSGPTSSPINVHGGDDQVDDSTIGETTNPTKPRPRFASPLTTVFGYVMALSVALKFVQRIYSSRDSNRSISEPPMEFHSESSAGPSNVVESTLMEQTVSGCACFAPISPLLSQAELKYRLSSTLFRLERREISETFPWSSISFRLWEPTPFVNPLRFPKRREYR